MENQGVGDSFRLELKNYVVVSTFQLELKNPGVCILLLVGSIEFRDLQIPLGWILQIGGCILLLVAA
jgi:hypothetical protein